MKSLKQDIKTGQFKQVYLLYGQESYLKKQYKNMFIKAMIPPGDTMNYAYYEGKNVNIPEVIDLAETLPFFAERRLLVFEDTGLFKAKGAELADYIKELPETTYFIFIEQEVDQRSKLFKAVKAKGHITELKVQDGATLKKWILGKVAKEKKKISESSIEFFLNKVGTDMEKIDGELEKLFSYTYERELITDKDIDEICTTHISTNIFAMIDAVANKEQRKALDLYYELLAMKEPPMKILALLVKQYHMLYVTKSMVKKGFRQNEIAAKIGVHPYAVSKYMNQSRKFSSAELRVIIEEGIDLEERVKTGRLKDILAVEIFLIKNSASAT